jgi:hypothetical protein
LKPFEVDECTTGTGATCGAIYLEQNFLALLNRKFGGHAASILTERQIKALLGHFNDKIKFSFNPLSDRCPRVYDEISIGGTLDLPEIGIEEGFLMLTRCLSFRLTNAAETRFKVSLSQSSRKLQI